MLHWTPIHKDSNYVFVICTRDNWQNQRALRKSLEQHIYTMLNVFLLIADSMLSVWSIVFWSFLLFFRTEQHSVFTILSVVMPLQHCVWALCITHDYSYLSLSAHHHHHHHPIFLETASFTFCLEHEDQTHLSWSTVISQKVINLIPKFCVLFDYSKSCLEYILLLLQVSTPCN